jgi:predicted AlkP superfamily phosphohydrolase/phosphomutase
MQVIVLGVPPSYPPRPLNGVHVGCFLTPSTQGTYTHPPEIRREIEAAAPGYVVDVEGFRTNDKAALLGGSATRPASTSRWRNTGGAGRGPVHDGRDGDRPDPSRVLEFMDPAHRSTSAATLRSAIRDYYVDVDRQVGELLSLMPRDTAVLVVSDHGARAIQGGICFNEWLIKHGWLTLKSYPEVPTPIGKAEIDWSKTIAWGDGGYYGRLFMNVKGREPQWTIDPRDY